MLRHLSWIIDMLPITDRRCHHLVKASQTGFELTLLIATTIPEISCLVLSFIFTMSIILKPETNFSLGIHV